MVPVCADRAGSHGADGLRPVGRGFGARARRGRTGRGITFKEPTVVGHLSFTAFHVLERGVVPLAQTCRPNRARAETVRIDLFVQEDGEITIGRVASSNRGDPDVALCLAHVFQDVARQGYKPEGGGIVTVEATLDPH